jgi:hypothetical protein
VGRSISISTSASTLTGEPFLVQALLPGLRGSTLGRWRGVVKICIKLRVEHINVDLSVAGGVTVGRIGERRSERHRLFFITDYHTVLRKVSRNPHDLTLVINGPCLGHTKSDSLFRARDGLERFNHKRGARDALGESERSVLAVIATSRRRRRSNRRDKTWNTGRSSGGNTARSNGRSSGGGTARFSSRYPSGVHSGFDVATTTFTS